MTLDTFSASASDRFGFCIFLLLQLEHWWLNWGPERFLEPNRELMLLIANIIKSETGKQKIILLATRRRNEASFDVLVTLSK